MLDNTNSLIYSLMQVPSNNNNNNIVMKEELAKAVTIQENLIG
jgi:hypothetical protein